MKVNGKELFLAPRITCDYISLQILASEQGGDIYSSTYLIAVMVSDSLKSFARCKWYEAHKWHRRLRYGKYSAKYLLKNCQEKELKEGYREVYILENGLAAWEDLKKKQALMEEQLREALVSKLAQDSLLTSSPASIEASGQ